MKFSVLAVLAAPVLVSAQYGAPADSGSSAASSSSSSAAPLPSAAPGQQLVQVGLNNGFTFTPNNLVAKMNTTVTFLFVQPSGFQHSITQSNFANPCTPLQGGFDSGLQDPGKQFTLTITNETQPIWFYCKQTNPLKHCGAQGMVGGINVAVSNKTVDDFVTAAKAVGDNEGPQTASGGLSGVGAVATAPASATSAGAASAPSSGAGQLTVGAGSLVATLFAFFALA